jgi:hypothetical protein
MGGKAEVREPYLLSRVARLPSVPQFAPEGVSRWTAFHARSA